MPREKTTLLNRNEVAQRLGMTFRAIVHRWDGLMADGLKAFQIGRIWKVRESELQRFIDQMEKA